MVDNCDSSSRTESKI
jgi:hypothetical protein